MGLYEHLLLQQEIYYIKKNLLWVFVKKKSTTEIFLDLRIPQIFHQSPNRKRKCEKLAELNIHRQVKDRELFRAQSQLENKGQHFSNLYWRFFLRLSPHLKKHIQKEPLHTVTSLFLDLIQFTEMCFNTGYFLTMSYFFDQRVTVS